MEWWMEQQDRALCPPQGASVERVGRMKELWRRTAQMDRERRQVDHFLASLSFLDFALRDQVLSGYRQKLERDAQELAWLRAVPQAQVRNDATEE